MKLTDKQQRLLEEFEAILLEEHEAERRLEVAQQEMRDAVAAAERDFSRHLGEDWLDQDRSDDPMTVWMTLSYCRVAGRPVPPWVIASLQRTASAVFDALITSPPPGVSEAEAVGRALGFGTKGPGHSGVGAHARMGQRYLKIALRVAELERAGVQRSAAVREAAEEACTSTATVYLALQRAGRLASAMLE